MSWLAIATIFDTFTNIFTIVTIVTILIILFRRTKTINKISDIKKEITDLQSQYNTFEERFVKYLMLLDHELRKARKKKK